MEYKTPVQLYMVDLLPQKDREALEILTKRYEEFERIVNEEGRRALAEWAFGRRRKGENDNL